MKSKTIEDVLKCAEPLFCVSPTKAKQVTNTSYELLVILMITLNTTCSGFQTAVLKKDTV